MARSRIGEAYLQIVPAMDGFFRQLNTSMGPGMNSAGAAAGSRFGGVFSAALAKAVDFAKIGIGLTAALGGVANTLIAKGGITRALNIEDAEAKLAALKYSTKEIAVISKSAMASVDKTTYSFDIAMKIAASSLAAGIKQGDDLTSYLKLVADGATVSGASLEDMGYIFNKIQGNGTAFAQELNMMADRGLPIFAWLAKEAGMSVAELRKEVTKGHVSAVDFRKAVEVNIGGAATTAATTTRGFAANVKAAFSRLGAAWYGGILPILKNTFIQSIPIIDAMTKATKAPAASFWTEAQKRFDPAFKAWAAGMTAAINGGKGLLPSFDELNKKGSEAMSWIHGLFGTVQASPFGKFFDEVVGKSRDFLTNLKPIGAIWQDSLLPPLMAFWAQAQPVFTLMGNNMKALFTTLAPMLKEMFVQIGPLMGTIGTTLLGVFKMIQADVYPVLIGFIGDIGGTIMKILPQILEFAGMLFAMIGPLFTELIPIVAETLGTVLNTVMQIASGLLPIIAAILPIVMQLIQTIMPVVLVLAKTLFEVIGDIFEAIAPSIATIMPVIQQLATMVGNTLVKAFGYLMPGIFSVIGLLKPLGELIGVVLQLVLQLAGPALSVLGGIVMVIINAIAGGLSWIMIGLSWLIKGLIGWVTMFANAIAAIWNYIAEAINGMTIDLPDWLKDWTGLQGKVDINVAPVSYAEMPKMAKGGIVHPRPGGVPTILAEAGRAEAVTDLGLTNDTMKATRDLAKSVMTSAGSGDTTIVNLDVHPAPGMNEQELADKVYKIFRRNARTI